MSFVHLHVHSEYSLLDGFSNIKKLVQRAKELEMPALALTDHGTMFGVMSFYNEATKAGIQPIIGVEAYMAARTMQDRDPQFDKRSSHLLLLAENQTGYQNLLHLASAAQLEGFYYNPRIDHELLATHSEGLICTSGCLSAEIPRAIASGNFEKARKKLDWYYEVFGPDRFFIELQNHDIDQLHEVNRSLLELGGRYQSRFVATNDVHYVDAEDARLQDILLAIQTSCVLSDPNRMRMSGESYYLRSADEMRSLFGEVPGAVENTLLIAERCELDLGFKGYRLPEFEVPEGYDPESYLRELCEKGLERRYGSRAKDPAIQERLDYELKIIHEMGFDTYFLIVWDLCQFANENNIWYNARGSAAGSIVAYTLEITMVDPIEHGLIFERFLNPGRISMPDIDLDFQDDLRHKMLEYCGQRYGEDKVAQIITFGTLKARAAVRDVGRVMDIPLNEVDRLAKHIPNIPGKPVSIAEALEKITDLQKAYSSAEFVKDLIETAKDMEGVVRNAGTHAAGVIITDKPIVEYVPLHRPTGSAAEDSPIKTVTQFEMETLDALGLLKVDFLGLATLTIMARACQLIEERHGIRFDLSNIPTDDSLTYELLGRGETAGVFQVEGSGMRRYLVQMKPRTLDHVVAMVALFRPGPMDFIPTYINRMHDKEDVSYIHPSLEPIFEETYGIPVYQEQIMRAAVDIAGYRATESDDLRKAIAKKIKAKLMKHREKFVTGSAENGVPKEVANQIFSDWEEFARYGFNKCLTGNTEVLDAATGRLVRIEELYRQKLLISETTTMDPASLALKHGQVVEVYDNGVKPVYRLTTELGRRIEATANHPFFTPEGWEPLERLAAGSHIAVPARIPFDGQDRWTDEALSGLVRTLADQVDHDPHAEIPAAVFGLGNNQIGRLLAELWQTIGHIDIDTKRLALATASEKLARQIVHLLLRLGIVSRLRSAGDLDTQGSMTFQVSVAINRQDGALVERIASSLRGQKHAAVKQPVHLAWQFTRSEDILPTETYELVSEIEPGDSPTWQLPNKERRLQAYTHSLRAPEGNSGPPGLWRSEIHFDEPALQFEAESDIYWDRIVEISYIGEAQTYDLEIAETHNFVANDIIVHNSHAVDYGYIAVQTAYLKAHYPVEYMTALLSVTKNDTDKVAYYVADCRRMGIEVMPPDVNASDWDFVIEDCEDGSAGIRFGMGAVKNVGMGPVGTILAAREDGPFEDINDFARRVDLRAVGKRALECLIKVGAFASFAPRVVLMEAMDQIHAVSASHFRAKESGQMSLFGAQTGLHADITLPRLSYDISRREQLNWEKELIGLFVSDHPLNPYLEDFQRVVTHFSAQLSEAQDREVVRVAGIITQVRPHQTRAGKPMSFAKLEDLQGTIELVVFPSVWGKYADLIYYDNVVLVQGKVDGRSSEPKVLVDTVSTEFALVGPADQEPSTPRSSPSLSGNGRPEHEEQPEDPIEPAEVQAAEQVDREKQPEAEPNESTVPPPPETFPDSWDTMVHVDELRTPAGENRPQDITESVEPAEAPPPPAPAEAAIPDSTEPPEKKPEEPPEPSESPAVPVKAIETGTDPPPPLPVTAPPVHPFLETSQESAPPSEPIQMLTIVLRGTGDRTRDILHLRRIHGTLISYPGGDRFAFYMIESGRSYVLEFPNFTTGICQQLLDRLDSLVGSENVKIEKLTFQ